MPRKILPGIDAFRHWRERKAYTLDEAARALGLGCRIVAYREKSDRPIPRGVAPATRALDLV
jgi:hypothetical protein